MFTTTTTCKRCGTTLCIFTSVKPHELPQHPLCGNCKETLEMRYGPTTKCDKCGTVRAGNADLYTDYLEQVERASALHSRIIEYKKEIARLKLDLQMEKDDYSGLLARNNVLSEKIERLRKELKAEKKDGDDAVNTALYWQSKAKEYIAEQLNTSTALRRCIDNLWKERDEYKKKYEGLLHERNKTVWRL